MSWFEDKLGGLGRWLDERFAGTRETLAERLGDRGGGPKLAERWASWHDGLVERWGETPTARRRWIVGGTFAVLLIGAAITGRILLDKPEAPPLTKAQQDAFVKVELLMQQQQQKLRMQAAATSAGGSAGKPGGK